MSFHFLTYLREINDNDQRIFTLTLLIDITRNLILDRTNIRHNTLPDLFIKEIFSEEQTAAIQCL